MSQWATRYTPSPAGYGIGTSTGAVTFNPLLQATAPAETRGRVLATFDRTLQIGRLASRLCGATPGTLCNSAIYWAGAVLLDAAAVGWTGVPAR